MKIIAICGISGSGKTTIAKRMAQNYSDKIMDLSQDAYYKSYDEYTIQERKNINYDSPDAFDIKLLEKQLKELKEGKEIDYPIYSFSEYSRIGNKKMKPKELVVIDGMLVLHFKEIRELLDDSIFLDCEDNIALDRMLRRDVIERNRTEDEIIKRYKRDIKPMNELYVKPQKSYANKIITTNDNFDNTYKSIKIYLKEKDYI